MLKDTEIVVCHAIMHSCSRVHKLAAAQKASGLVSPYIYNCKFAPQHPSWQYDMAFKFFEWQKGNVVQDHFMRMAERIDELIDLWHVHNEPDWLVKLIRSVSGKPIIWDLHDLKSHKENDTKYLKDEDDSANMSDRILTVSEGYASICQKRWPDKEVGVYNSMVPLKWFPDLQKDPTMEGVVYEGGVSSVEGHPRNVWRFWENCGVPVAVFPAHNVSGEFQVASNISIFECADVFTLYKSLAQYEAGIFVCEREEQFMTGVMPNKLFEYLCAGIPIIACNVPDVEDFLVMNPGLGVSVKGPEEVPAALQKIRDEKMRLNTHEFRKTLTMDEQFLKRVYPVYEELLGM